MKALDNDWNAAKLAPAVGLLYGYKLYVGPHGPGKQILMHANDPPLSYLLYAPAGLFSRPTHAIIAGSCISFALFYRPGVRPGVLAAEGRRRGPILTHPSRHLAFRFFQVALAESSRSRSAAAIQY